MTDEMLAAAAYAAANDTNDNRTAAQPQAPSVNGQHPCPQPKQQPNRKTIAAASSSQHSHLGATPSQTRPIPIPHPNQGASPPQPTNRPPSPASTTLPSLSPTPQSIILTQQSSDRPFQMSASTNSPQAATFSSPSHPHTSPPLPASLPSPTNPLTSVTTTRPPPTYPPSPFLPSPSPSSPPPHPSTSTPPHTYSTPLPITHPTSSNPHFSPTSTPSSTPRPHLPAPAQPTCPSSTFSTPSTGATPFSNSYPPPEPTTTPSGHVVIHEPDKPTPTSGRITFHEPDGGSPNADGMTPPPLQLAETSTSELQTSDLALFGEEEDDEDEGDVEETAGGRWWRRHKADMMGLVVTLLLVAAGVLMLIIVRQEERHDCRKEVQRAMSAAEAPGPSSTNSARASPVAAAWAGKCSEQVAQSYRWLLFAAGVWPLWFGTRLLVNQISRFVEWVYFREALYYLVSLQMPARLLLFFVLMLPVNRVVFLTACGRGRCDNDAYKKAVEVVWHIQLTLMLLALASFLKALFAKLLCTHFYRTAHLAKVQDALEKEYQLLVLSEDRWKVEARAAAEREKELQALQQAEADEKLGRPSRFKAMFGFGRSRGDCEPVKDVSVGAGSCRGSSSQVQEQEAPRRAREGPKRERELRRMEETRKLRVLQRVASTRAPQLPPPTLPPSTPHDSIAITVAASDVSASVRSDTHHPPASLRGSLHMSEASRTGDHLLRQPHASSRTNAIHQLDETEMAALVGGVGSLGGSSVRNKSMLWRAASGRSVMSKIAEAEPAAEKGVERVGTKELQKMRNGIYIRTFTALLRRAARESGRQEEARTREAKRYARAVFNNMRGDDRSREWVEEADLKVFLPDGDSAAQVLRWMDRDGDGRLGKEDVRDTILAVYSERKNMAASLKDTHSIVGSLEVACGILLYIVAVLTTLSIWGINIWKGWSTLSAVVLAFAFVFGNTLKTLFESLVFLLMEHPYDVGDVLLLDEKTYRVLKIKVLYTVMLQGTGERVYFPTSKLMTLPIANLTTSAHKSDSVKVCVDVGTKVEVLAALERALEAHMQACSTEFEGKPSVGFTDVVDPCKVKLSVGWTYSFSGEDAGRVATAKSGVVAVVQQVLSSEGVEYSGAPLKVKLP